MEALSLGLCIIIVFNIGFFCGAAWKGATD